VITPVFKDRRRLTVIYWNAANVLLLSLQMSTIVIRSACLPPAIGWSEPGALSSILLFSRSINRFHTELLVVQTYYDTAPKPGVSMFDIYPVPIMLLSNQKSPRTKEEPCLNRHPRSGLASVTTTEGHSILLSSAHKGRVCGQCLQAIQAAVEGIGPPGVLQARGDILKPDHYSAEAEGRTSRPMTCIGGHESKQKYKRWQPERRESCLPVDEGVFPPKRPK